MNVLNSIEAPHVFIFPEATEDGEARLVFQTQTDVYLCFGDGSQYEVLNVSTYGDLEDDEEASFIVTTAEGVFRW